MNNFKGYIIARKLKSGGSVRIELNEDGDPCYTENIEDSVIFCKQWDAKKFMAHCKLVMPTYEGQGDWITSGV